MDTIVSDIAKCRMERDVNKALKPHGLFVSAIKFDASTSFSIIIELGAYDNTEICLTKNIAVPEGTAC